MRHRRGLGIQPQGGGQTECGHKKSHIGSDEKDDTRILRQSKETIAKRLAATQSCGAVAGDQCGVVRTT
jgi:hypothetical protein